MLAKFDMHFCFQALFHFSMKLHTMRCRYIAPSIFLPNLLIMGTLNTSMYNQSAFELAVMMLQIPALQQFYFISVICIVS